MEEQVLKRTSGRINWTNIICQTIDFVFCLVVSTIIDRQIENWSASILFGGLVFVGFSIRSGVSELMRLSKSLDTQ
jgi:hypothetical protein